MRWCGICGTDLEEYRNGPLFIPVGIPHPLTGARAPITLGHEVSGEVVAVGPGVEWEMGTLVAADGLMSCGRCRYCLRHRITLCEQLSSIGLMCDGGLAEYVNVPARGCARLPEGMDEAGALAETLAVGVRALRRGRMAPGDRVAVLGAGAVGLLAIQGAVAMGASEVIAVDPDETRLQLAALVGATDVAKPGDSTDADLVLECSGAPAAVRAAIATAAPAGRIVLVSITPDDVALRPFDLVVGERELIGSLSHVYDEDFVAAVRMIAVGIINTAPLITSRIRLSRAIDDGLLALGRDGSAQVKILVAPDDR